MRHVTAPEPSLARRRDPGLQDTWQFRSPPRQGSKVRGRGTRGSAEARLGREATFGATGHVVAQKPTSAGGEVRSCRTHGSTWMHALLLVLT
jgi:hypothetical protein